jgi:hypothetical protein
MFKSRKEGLYITSLSGSATEKPSLRALPVRAYDRRREREAQPTDSGPINGQIQHAFPGLWASFRANPAPLGIIKRPSVSAIPLWLSFMDSSVIIQSYSITEIPRNQRLETGQPHRMIIPHVIVLTISPHLIHISSYFPSFFNSFFIFPPSHNIILPISFFSFP